MTELSNAVTVLIARMESHPEDFGVVNGAIGRPKFNDVANALYGLVGMDKEMSGAYWFLTDADKEALIEAWKKLHRTCMEKEVMEKIFDDGEGEREAEARMKKRVQRHQAQQMAAQIGAADPRAIYGNAVLNNNSTVQPWQNAQNAAQNSTGNTGLFGSASQAFQGIFR